MEEPREKKQIISSYGAVEGLASDCRDTLRYASLRVLVMAAPPTPNGDLHVGHLSGPYLAGDIQSRYLRLRGAEVHFFTGTDDNQSDVKIHAMEAGVSPQQVADQMAESIASTLRGARIDVDQFIRPNSSLFYVPTVQDFLGNLYARGLLISRVDPTTYCEPCRRQLYENYISGHCPYCGSRTTGSGCESCGMPNRCVDLLDPVCAQCGAPPSFRAMKRLYFPLDQYSGRLQEYWSKVAMSSNLRSFCEQALQVGFWNFAVSHYDNWGVPIAIPGFEGQTVYTWCDEAARYLTYAQHLDGRWEQFWKNGDSLAIQCFGFDNAFYYAVLVPALLMAFDSQIRLPSALLMNEFRLLDHSKFSTSRQHAIWGQHLLSRVPADSLRFHMATTYPEVERTNFSLAELAADVDRELIREWQAWLRELAVRAAREFEERVPGAGSWAEEHLRFAERLTMLTAQASKAYEARTFSPQCAASVLGWLVRDARRFAKSEESWLRVIAQNERRRTAVALELLAAKLLAILSAPIMPNFAERLWKELGFQGSLWENKWEDIHSLLPVGQRLLGLAATSYFSFGETGESVNGTELDEATIRVALEGSHILHIRPETTDLDVYREIFREKPHILEVGHPPKVIVDGGANIGASSVDFALRYPDARIIAIEPEEHNFQLLVRNSMPFPNIFPVRGALWCKKACVQVIDGGSGAWGFQTVEGDLDGRSVMQTVPAVTVDGLMEEYGISFIDILKLDIEGSEVEVLETSASWLPRVDTLILELHEDIRPSCRHCHEIITKYFDHVGTSGDKIICRRKA
ncbi:MAG: FkbM family methyltransferase [Acidobacteriota bacterium]